MKILFIILLLLIPFCLGECVDINSASLEELETIKGIGPVIAERIIEERPFEKIEELDRVKGIGNKTLEKIKQEGVACVLDNDKRIEEQEDIERKNESFVKEIAEEKIIEEIKEEFEEIILLNEGDSHYDLVYESKESKISKFIVYFILIILSFVIAFLIFDK